jgi:hypothetical protein
LGVPTRFTPDILYQASPTEDSQIAIYTKEGIFGGSVSSKTLELSVSTDGGKTWETNWVSELTREK